MNTSASQITTFLDCPRKFWFDFIIRMPRPENQNFKFGEVLHNVIERWLLADDLGNGPDLYPEHWNDGLPPVESDLIQRLVTKAIEEGVVTRQPGRRVEQWVRQPLIPGLEMVGKIDVSDREGIEDHKTAKNTRYLETPKTLSENAQLLIYAYIWLQDQSKAPDSIKLRHNQFVKDLQNPQVRYAETRVTPAMVDQYWNEVVVPAANAILALHQQQVPLADWKKVQGPKTSDACKKYGGCPYASVCGMIEQPEVLHARLARQSAPPDPKPRPMSIFNKNRPNASTPARSAPGVPVGNAPAGDAVVASPALPADPAVAEASAPWAFKDCPVCKGLGLNPRTLQPCGACEIVHKQRGLPTIGIFTWTVKDGVLYWRSDATKAAGKMTLSPSVTAPEQRTAPVAPVEPEPVAETPAPAKKRGRPRKNTETQVAAGVVPPTEPATAPAVDTNSMVSPSSPAQSEPRPGYPPFILVINNAISMVTPMTVLSLDKLHAQLAEEIAKAAEVTDYYAMNEWKRKDLMTLRVREAAKTFPPNVVLTAMGRGLEIQTVIEALRPFAAATFQGMGA